MFYEELFKLLNKNRVDYIVDLIQLKKISGRKQDLEDIKALQKIKKDENKK